MQLVVNSQNGTDTFPLNLVDSNVAVGTWVDPPPPQIAQAIFNAVVECSHDNKAEFTVEYSAGIYRFGFDVSFSYDPQNDLAATSATKELNLTNVTINYGKGGWLFPPGIDEPVNGWKYYKIIAVYAR
jgi:hypothetical protein